MDTQMNIQMDMELGIGKVALTEAEVEALHQEGEYPRTEVTPSQIEAEVLVEELMSTEV
jgi:hypothetical protein